MPRPSIVVDDVHKDFKLRHTHSIKETFVAAMRRKPLTTDFHALDGMSFTIDAGRGRRAARLQRVGQVDDAEADLRRARAPTAGEVLTRGRVAGLIEVGAGFHPDLSGRENIFLNAAILGMSKKEIEARFDDIVAFSEIEQFIDTEVKHYSSGMFLRLAFSVAIHTEVGRAADRRDPLRRRRAVPAQVPGAHPRAARGRQDAGRRLARSEHGLGPVQRGILLRGGKIVFDGRQPLAVKELRS